MGRIFPILENGILGKGKGLTMRDYIDIGPTPTEEECTGVGQPGYEERARLECRVFLDQIRRQLGPEPPGARLAIKRNPHDFGDYLDVVCYFDGTDQAAMDYAFSCEAAVDRWDATAKRELQGLKP